MKNTRTKTEQEKEAIIAEYLTGELSYRKLGVKYGINFRMLHLWVTKFSGKPLKQPKHLAQKDHIEEEESLSSDVRQLQVELRKAKLHIELLNSMIDIAEDQLKIDIRKKSGTKR